MPKGPRCLHEESHRSAPFIFRSVSDLAQNKLHLRKIGGVIDLRADQARHCVLGVADISGGSPRSRPTEKMARLTPPCKVSGFGLLALPGMSFGNSSEGQFWSSAPDTFRARGGVDGKSDVSRMKRTLA